MFSFFQSHGSDVSLVQGSFRATPLPLFMSSYDQDRELGDVPQPRVFFFCVNLDYPDISDDIFDL